MYGATKCYFHGCDLDAVAGSWKCANHRYRGRCAVQDCRYQVYAKKLCVQHGGKPKCRVEGCQVTIRVGDYCSKHIPTEAIKFCSVEGCATRAHLGGKCFRHGGGKNCAFPHCTKYARIRRLCARHAAETKAKAITVRQVDGSPPQRVQPEVVSLLAYYYLELGKNDD
ncbi:hypothetical protein AeRB84_003945 [Aphanomyces euteiches]|nr:hypothetical protein AeRB84_003945 [Aphanomyces euteiches]